MTHKWSPDRPGERPEHDLLGRDIFAQQISKELRAWKNKESLVIGLNGDWGSGKTTLTNLILHHISEQAVAAKETAPTVVRFNPWEWSGQNLLFEAFFGEIGESIGRKDDDKRSKKLATGWKLLGSYFRLGRVAASIIARSSPLIQAGAAATGSPDVIAAAAGATTAASIAEGSLAGAHQIAEASAATHESRETASLIEIRVELKSLLAEMNAPLVVVIDDIDRLTREQIRMLVQLVKANADFPNVVYLMLYQKNIVADALNEVNSDKGNDFLKKIVQIELEVPAAPDGCLRKMLLAGIELIWRRAQLRWDIDCKERWRHLFEKAVWPYFKTPRDIKRFLSVFDFYFEGHTDSGYLTVNPIDLVLIEVLRMFDTEALDILSREFQRNRQSNLSMFLADTDERQSFIASVKMLIENRNLVGYEKSRLQALIYGLFPQAFDSAKDSFGNEAEWDRDYRACHRKHFPKYFQLQPIPGDVSAKFIACFFEKTADRLQCQKLIVEAITNHTLVKTVERLWIIGDDFSKDRIAPIVGALIDMTDSLPMVHAGIGFSGDIEREITRLAHYLLTRVSDISNREEIFIDVIESSMAITGTVFLTAILDQDSPKNNEASDVVVRVETVEVAKKTLLPRIRTLIRKPEFWDFRLALMFIYRLRDWASLSEVKVWLDEAIKDPEIALKFLRITLHETQSSGGRGAFMIHSLQAKDIEEFVDLDLLLTQVKKINEYGRMDGLAVEKLQQATALKAAGQPYARIPLMAFDSEGNEAPSAVEQLL